MTNMRKHLSSKKQFWDELSGAEPHQSSPPLPPKAAMQDSGLSQGAHLPSEGLPAWHPPELPWMYTEFSAHLSFDSHLPISYRDVCSQGGSGKAYSASGFRG